MLAHVTKLFSSSRRTVCTPCFLFLRKIEILFYFLYLHWVFQKNSIFLKNRKKGVQTVRLDELNNIVTWANISFISKS